MPLDPFTQNRSLSSEQGYELARVSNKMGLPVELRRLIWADVTKNYYSRGSLRDRAASVLQAAWRRLMAIADSNGDWRSSYSRRYYEYCRRASMYEQAVFEQNYCR